MGNLRSGPVCGAMPTCHCRPDCGSTCGGLFAHPPRSDSLMQNPLYRDFSLFSHQRFSLTSSARGGVAGIVDGTRLGHKATMALGATAVVMTAYGAGPERKTKVLLLVREENQAQPCCLLESSPPPFRYKKNRPSRFSVGPPRPPFCSLFR
ncbi:hypothetical protein LZ31DRAFT_364570 [Colletotrichum somersetense]|nr:hypothetical protein LZ31DRAFT_364570 [Colletotrichum somersetense]